MASRAASGESVLEGGCLTLAAGLAALMAAVEAEEERWVERWRGSEAAASEAEGGGEEAAAMADCSACAGPVGTADTSAWRERSAEVAAE